MYGIVHVVMYEMLLLLTIAVNLCEGQKGFQTLSMELIEENNWIWSRASNFRLGLVWIHRQKILELSTNMKLLLDISQTILSEQKKKKFRKMRRDPVSKVNTSFFCQQVFCLIIKVNKGREQFQSYDQKG